MFKTKIVGIGNRGKYNYLIVNKSKDFFQWLNDFLYKSFGVHDVSYYEDYKNKKGEWVSKKRRINSCKDLHESYNSNGVQVSVFYGNKKVFISIYCSLAKRKKFIKVISEISNWTKKKL